MWFMTRRNNMATPVLCYPNYTIDEFGNVFSIRKNRYLKHNISKKGYHSVELFNEKGFLSITRTYSSLKVLKGFWFID